MAYRRHTNAGCRGSQLLFADPKNALQLHATDAATIVVKVEFTLANYHAGVYLSPPYELHRSSLQPDLDTGKRDQTACLPQLWCTHCEVDMCQLCCCLKSFLPAHRASLSEPWTGGVAGQTFGCRSGPSSWLALLRPYCCLSIWQRPLVTSPHES